MRSRAAAKPSLILLFSMLGLSQASLAEQAPSLDSSEVAQSDMVRRTGLPEPVATAIREHRYVAAEQLLSKQIDNEGASPVLLRVLGGVYFLDGKNADCVRIFKQLDSGAALDDSSRFTLAMSYIKLDRLDQARSELQRLADAHPDRVLYPYWLARLDFVEQKFELAINRLQKIIKNDPTFVRAYDSLGLCYEALNDTARSKIAFESAVQVNRSSRSPSPWPELDYSELLIKLSDYGGARKHAEEALRWGPNLPVGHYHLAAALEMLNLDTDAIAELKKAASLDPAYAQPYYALARIYRRQGRNDLAQEAVKTFKRLNRPS
jgi:tetratricopeptide (TPR) repeat protein